MDYHVSFTERALRDLADLVSHIAADDSEAASRFGNVLLDHVDLLGRFPKMGATIRERSPVRKLVHSPILAYYLVHEDKQIVEVLHFRHGSRRLPEF